MLNIGSITKIEIARADEISLGTPNSSNEVTVTNAGSWDEPDFTIESASFNETEKKADAGAYYVSKLSYQLPKIMPGSHQAAHKYPNLPVVIRITDGNGNKIVIGEVLNPVFIKVLKNIPAPTAGINAYIFEANYQSPHPAYFSA